MNPKIVMSPGKRYGRSFKGLVNYISSEARDPETGKMSEGRVAYTYVRNLPSDSSSIAWKTMAATAMNREQLKKAAGVGPGGRQDKGEVFHLILNWHESERDMLSEAHIEQSADATLKYLGLTEHQAYGKLHDQPGKHPHLHLAINRVNPETGKMASDWRSQTKLSKWALEYQKQHGGVVVEQRVANWKAREQGLELPRQLSRHRADYEADKAAEGSKAIRERLAKHRDDRERYVRQRTEHRRRGEAYRETAYKLHHKRIEQVNALTEQAKADARKRIERAFLKEHQLLVESHCEQVERFDQNQQSFLGRVKNRIAYTDWRKVDQLTSQSGLTRFFNAWSEAGFPRAQKEKRQQQELDRLHEYRRQMHERREQRLDELLRQRILALRTEHTVRVAAFSQMQDQTAIRLDEQRKRLDRDRRFLTKLGKEAEFARELLNDNQRPTAQAKRAFKHEKDNQERGDGRISSTANIAASTFGEVEQQDYTAGQAGSSERQRIRRPRRLRGQVSTTVVDHERQILRAREEDNSWEVLRDYRACQDDREH